MPAVSPKRLAILIGTITAIVSVGGAFIIFMLEIKMPYIHLAFLALIVFLVVFLFTFYALNNFIYEKIKPIYKTIHNIQFSEEKLTNNLEDRDVIKDVQKDVLVWARRKTKEIAQLRQLEKYRREYLGNVSHELKTPIFNIQGYVSTLLDGGLHDDNINQMYLERTDRSVNRLISIVNDLESISRLESGQLKLEFTKFDIIKLFEDSFDEHEMIAAEQNIKLKFTRKSDKALNVMADKERIFEVINNLIKNSIKYGKKGGTTEIDFSDMDQNILIEIKDNGIGISNTDLPRIFERFYRADKSRSREMGGTGLGLSIVKHIIEAHNQTISVQSKQNQGSSFTFTLKKV